MDVYSSVLEFNQASRRTQEKCGYQLLDTRPRFAPDTTYYRNGRPWREIWLKAQTGPEWLTRTWNGIRTRRRTTDSKSGIQRKSDSGAQRGKNAQRQLGAFFIGKKKIKRRGQILGKIVIGDNNVADPTLSRAGSREEERRQNLTNSAREKARPWNMLNVAQYTFYDIKGEREVVKLSTARVI